MPHPSMLDDEGRPLPTFGFLNAHQAFRRDTARFVEAGARLADGGLDAPALDALRDHWRAFRTFLEEHHRAEDDWLFPAVARLDPALAATIDGLATDHEQLHELLPAISAQLERASDLAAATEVHRSLRALQDLLEPHLATEEEHLVAVLLEAMRSGAIQPPAGDEAAPPVPIEVMVPFSIEHLDEHLQSQVLARFPVEVDPEAAQQWLEAYRRRLALWVG